MEHIDIFLKLILIFVIFIFILDTIQLFRLRKLLKDYQIQEQFNIDKYHELKWRINSMITVIIATAFILSYIGLDIKENITNKFNEYKVQVKEVDTLIARQKSELHSIDSIKNEIQNVFIIYKQKIEALDKKLNQVQAENERQSQVYIVSKISFPKSDSSKRIYYRDLNTNTGNLLPIFRAAPIINIIINERASTDVYINQNNKDFFEVKRVPKMAYLLKGLSDVATEIKGETESFDLWISNQ